MAESKNIFLKRQVAADNIDSLNKTGVAEIKLRNGDMVAIGQKEKGIYKLSAPTGTTKRFGVVYNADVVTEGDGKYRGLSDDPRDLVFEAGTVVNFYIPKIEDEVAVTEVSGTETGATHLVADGVGYKYATAAGTSIAYEIEGVGFVSVGNERIPTVKAVCVNV